MANVSSSTLFSDDKDTHNEYMHQLSLSLYKLEVPEQALGLALGLVVEDEPSRL